jgi:hypothetical protein
MNIRLKAALEVVGFVATATIMGAVASLTLEYLKIIFGEREVVNGVVTVICVGGAAFMLKLMYDIRVAQLGYERKLKEMVKK